MIMHLIRYLALVAAFGFVSIAPSWAQSPEVLSRVAFGSCNHEGDEQPMWSAISRQNPDLWIWLGDNIYADTENMAAMDSMYAVQRRNPGYRAFASTTPVIGTWDDHDYGANDAGRTYPKRDSSQHLFLDFMDVPDDHPRRMRRGVYSAHTYGPPGRRVKIILLDTRYHRDPLQPDTTTEQRYRPNSTGDILGAAQWRWLEDQLRTSDAQVHLIGTSIQAVPQDHPWEKWANFPAARARLFRTLRQYNTPGVVLISGDRHIAELSRHDDALAYPLYEMTASGLTHSYDSFKGEPNRHRVGDPFTRLNYGLISIDWAADPAVLHLSVRDRDNTVQIEQVIPLSDLQPSASEGR